MITIKLLDGETISTSQYTKAEAEAAKAAGQIDLAIPGELGYADLEAGLDADSVLAGTRTIFAAAVASIEEAA